MKNHTVRTLLTAITTAGVIITATLVFHSSRVEAQTDQDDHDSRIEIGLRTAPVPLKLTGKDRALVGLGGYLVNGIAACNDCHSLNRQTEFVAGGNPYFGQPVKVNPETYLGGGTDFGSLTTAPASPHIIARNLTPDKTGLPVGGRSYSQFREIIRTGVDLDHLHPTCSPGQTANCLPPPFDGNLLQVMPWYAFQSMTERDIRAIYEYLSAIPCIEGPPAPSVLHNDCQ